MSDRRLATSLFAALSVLSAAGCSVLVLEPAECESDEQCQELFGAGAVCNTEGFCDLATDMDLNACNTAADCLGANGFGSTCAGGDPDADEPTGACQTFAVPPRCAARAFPSDLLSDIERHTTHVVFGVISDRSLQAHVDRENAIELAATQINENGGIEDHPIGLVFCDIQSGNDSAFSDGLRRPEAAIETAEWLVREAGVPVVIGPPSAGDTQLVFEEVTNAAAQRGQTLLITPSATDPSLTNFDIAQGQTPSDDNPGMLWRTAASAEPQISALVQHMTDTGVTNVAVIREQSPFAGTFGSSGETLAQAFSTAWNGESDQFSYEGGNASEREEKVREVGVALTEGTFDAILFIGPTQDSQAFITQATDNGDYVDGLPVYFPDTGALDEIFAEASGSRLFPSVYATRPVHPESAALNNFVGSYESSNGGASPLRSTFTAHAYDALWFAALGSTWAFSHGPESTSETESNYPILWGADIARGLRRTNVGTPVEFLPSSWSMASSQFRANRTIDIHGVASEYAFDLSTEEAPGTVELVQGTAEGTFVVPAPKQ